MSDDRPTRLGRHLRLSLAVALGLALSTVVAPMTSAADDAVSCAGGSSGWQLGDVDSVAADFFPHLFESYGFADAQAFADVLSSVADKNQDGDICAKVSKGDELNPNAHWYKIGPEIPVEGDEGPVYFLRVRDNNLK